MSDHWLIHKAMLALLIVSELSLCERTAVIRLAASPYRVTYKQCDVRDLYAAMKKYRR